MNFTSFITTSTRHQAALPALSRAKTLPPRPIPTATLSQRDLRRIVAEMLG